MDMWANIWTALSTPNELLIKFMLIPISFFIEMPLSLYLFTSVLNIKPSKKQKYIYIICLSIISLLTSNFIPSPFNFIINYLSYFLIIKFVLKLNFLNTLIAIALPAITFSLIGSFILNPYLQITNTDTTMINSIPIYRITFMLTMYLLNFIIVLLIKYTKFTIIILDDFSKKEKIIVASNFIIGILSILLQLYLTFYYIDTLPLSFTFFNFLCLLLYFAVSIYSLIKLMKLIYTTNKLKSEEEYNKTLKILHENVRGFKHDFDNIVTTIGGYVQTNDMDGLKNYYSQLQEDCQKVNNLYVLNPEIINNPGIYNLLTNKYNEAEEKDIKVNLTFLLDLNDLHMKIYEFARILGILLDNAIEAASECDEKVLNIEFRNESRNKRNIILVENTYSDKDVDLEAIFNKGVSGKENHTGLGLWEIRKFLKKNNNVNLHTSKTDKYFTQKLEIYY